MNRRLTLSVLLLAACLTGGVFSSTAQGCPMCKIAHEDSTDPAVQARPRAYMLSILFMLAMPATLTASYGVAFYRLAKKRDTMSGTADSE
jgi:hypothetical protein